MPMKCPCGYIFWLDKSGESGAIEAESIHPGLGKDFTRRPPMDGIDSSPPLRINMNHENQYEAFYIHFLSFIGVYRYL